MNTDLIKCLEDYNSIQKRSEDQAEALLFDLDSESFKPHHSQDTEEKPLRVNKTDKANMQKLLRSLSHHPELRDYHLVADDLSVISGIYQQTRENYDLDFTIKEVLGFLPKPPVDLKAGFEYLFSLVDRGIISFSYPPDQDFHSNLSSVLQSQYRLNGLVWNILLGKSPLKGCQTVLKHGFKEGNNPLEVVCDALDLLFEHYTELKMDAKPPCGIYYGKAVNTLLDKALEYISNLDPNHKLSKFISAHGLDPISIKCLFLLYFHQKRLNAELTVSALATLIAAGKTEYRQISEYLAQSNVLQQEALIEVSELSIFRNDLNLSDKALSELSTTDSKQSFDLPKFIAASPYFGLIQTGQTLDQLILPKPALESIKAIIARLQDPRRYELAQWGLLGASLSAEESVQHGCNVLLHGQPGTGKTYIAGVLANELGRPLLMINANQLRDMYYGSTEKRARALFREMRLIAREANPVFLLNEGDQLIHRRGGDLERSADVTENAIQSIFLEEMETFPGILLVTSNLAHNLDPAMSRRFHYKLEIPSPDAACRLKLWRLHLPLSIPGADAIDTEPLAQDFPFTGGQIRIVVQNACHASYSRGAQAKLSLDDLYHYSRLETGSCFENKSKVLGFR